MNVASSINPAFQEQNHIETSQNERLPFRHEQYRFLDSNGDIQTAGCELLLAINNPREFLTEHGIDGKERALKDGIEAARNLPDMPMISVNIDGDWANDLERVMDFEPFRNLPENLIFEITEVERLSTASALVLTAMALRKQGGVLIDDMPTAESFGNMQAMFEVMESVHLKYGVKVDFNTTHALLGRPMKGDPGQRYEEALQDLALMRQLMNESGAHPSWIVFEGLNYADELETVMNDFAPILDPREPEERAKILGQFFRDEVKIREAA